MKKHISFLLALSFTITNATSQDIYEEALSAASYAYAHSKKAHNANNVYHTQEFAEKAIESFQNAETLAEQCQCKKAIEIAFEARSDMESSLDQDTFERSRFFAKRAKEFGSQLLEELTNCQAKHFDDADAVADVDDQSTNEVELLANKQKELAQKRLLLAQEQQQLELQIAANQLKQQKLEALRADELKEQSLIKDKAEQALLKLKNAIQELSNVVLNEQNSNSFDSSSNFVRNDKELKSESLDETKSFYVNRAKELTKSALLQFAGNEIDN